MFWSVGFENLKVNKCKSDFFGQSSFAWLQNFRNFCGKKQPQAKNKGTFNFHLPSVILKCLCADNVHGFLNESFKVKKFKPLSWQCVFVHQRFTAGQFT